MDSDQRAKRLTYEESCRLLQQVGYSIIEEDGSIPPMPDHLPQQDDEGPLGVSFFRTFVGEGDLENLTLPRTFFSKSKVEAISFKNTDFSESSLCWNDFNEVSFEDADLSGSDLRATNYNNVRFIKTDLTNADLRWSIFESCDFTGANMQGVKLTRKQGKRMALSDDQRAVIDWQKSDGEGPFGG